MEKNPKWMEEYRIGQEWYFFAESRTYMIYDITLHEWKYPDGEIYDRTADIYLKSVDNRVKTIRPEDFVDTCKKISDTKSVVPVKVETHSVPNRSRLERIDD